MTMTVIGTLQTVSCCVCGTPFGIEETLFGHLQRRHEQAFYCPNGHRQNFVGPTPEEKLRRQLAEMEESRNLARARARSEHDRAENIKASLVATKGHLTRTKKRVAAGVCPCCHRTFQALSRHMSAKHPEYTATE